MIIIPRSKYIILSLAAITGVLFLGILGYLYINPDNKILSETFLFISLLIALFLIIMLFQTMFKSRNVKKEMDKLIHLSSIGGFTPGTSLKSFGELGEQISRLYYHLSLMNKKRALKIGSQKILLEFITNNFQSPVFVTDPTGKILYASKALLDKKEINRTDLIESDIKTILPELDIQSLTGEFETTHTFTEYDKTRENIRIYPITNHHNDIAYLVFIFGKQMLYFSEKKLEKDRILHSFLKKLVSR